MSDELLQEIRTMARALLEECELDDPCEDTVGDYALGIHGLVVNGLPGEGAVDG